MNNNKVIRLSKKKIGSREDVYNGIAQKTSGGMYQSDIILKKNNPKGKKYISKKISNRMKEETPLKHYKREKSLKIKNINNNIQNNNIQRNIQNNNIQNNNIQNNNIQNNNIQNNNIQRNIQNNNIQNNNIQRNIQNRKLSKKNVSFVSNNIVKEYVCSSMNSDSENEEDDNFLNINLNELNEIDLGDI